MIHHMMPADHPEVSTFAALLEAMLMKRVAEYTLGFLTSRRKRKGYAGLKP